MQEHTQICKELEGTLCAVDSLSARLQRLAELCEASSGAERGPSCKALLLRLAEQCASVASADVSVLMDCPVSSVNRSLMLLHIFLLKYASDELMAGLRALARFCRKLWSTARRSETVMTQSGMLPCMHARSAPWS